MTGALMRGGEDWREHFDRGAEWYVLADLYDALNQNTRATGNWKKGKAPDFPGYPRPGRDGEGKPKKTGKKGKGRTLADLYGQVAGPAAGSAEAGAMWQTI